MQKMMNMQKLMEENVNTREDGYANTVDKAKDLIVESEYILRNLMINLLDTIREVMIEAMEEEPELKSTVMMTCDTAGNLEIVTADDLESKYPDKEFAEVAVVFDGELILAFDPADEVFIGDTSYVMGPVLFYEADAYGNDANIDRETITKAVDYADCGLTEIHVDDSVYPVFRLI